MTSTSRLSGSKPAAPGTGTSMPKPNLALVKLLELKGIGKGLFASLCGGEDFIRRERRTFADTLEKQ